MLKSARGYIAARDCDRYVESIIGVHNMIAEQLERIVGYINYKVTTFPKTSTGLLNSATTGTYIAGRAQFVAQMLNAAAAEYAVCNDNDKRIIVIGNMFDTVQQFMSQVSTAVAQFELVEKRVQAA